MESDLASHTNSVIHKSLHAADLTLPSKRETTWELPQLITSDNYLRKQNWININCYWQKLSSSKCPVSTLLMRTWVKAAVLELTPKEKKYLYKLQEHPWMKIQFHCRSQLHLQQKLNSEERKWTCKQPLALHNPKALQMLPTTSQDPRGTAHSEEGRLQRPQFSPDTTNPSPKEQYSTAQTITETFNSYVLRCQAHLLQTHSTKWANYWGHLVSLIPATIKQQRILYTMVMWL